MVIWKGNTFPWYSYPIANHGGLAFGVCTNHPTCIYLPHSHLLCLKSTNLYTVPTTNVWHKIIWIRYSREKKTNPLTFAKIVEDQTHVPTIGLLLQIHT
jgi:hypothetical protein